MKKIINLFSTLFVFFAVLTFNNGVAFAKEEKKKCTKPRFYMFKPENRAHVDPSSEISFRVTGVVDPTTVTLKAKKINVELEMEDRNIFYIFKGRLPDSLSGTAARISVAGNSKQSLGGCSKRDGWLLLINEAPAAGEEVASDSSKEAAAAGAGQEEVSGSAEEAAEGVPEQAKEVKAWSVVKQSGVK